MGTSCPNRVASWLETAPGTRAARARLLHVLPVFLLQQVSKHEQHAQREQHDDADRAAIHAGRLSDVDQEIDEVAYRGVVLRRGLRALGDFRPLVLPRSFVALLRLDALE